MKRIMIILVTLFLSSCATVGKYKNLPTRVERLEKQLDILQRNSAGISARIDDLNISTQIIEGKIEESRYSISDVGSRLDAVENNLGQRIFSLEQKIHPAKRQIPPKPSTLTTPKPIENNSKNESNKSSNNLKFPPRQLYQTAYDDYVKRNYNLALAGFQRYIKKYPRGELASGAQYWIGECHYSGGDFENAVSEFDKVIILYPNSNKVRAAKLKKAYSLIQLGKKSEAISLFKEIINQYPLSTEAKLSKQKKSELEKEE